MVITTTGETTSQITIFVRQRNIQINKNDSSWQKLHSSHIWKKQFTLRTRKTWPSTPVNQKWYNSACT